MGGGRPGVDTVLPADPNQPGQVSDETKLFGIIGSGIVVGADDRVTVGADAGGYQPIGRGNVQAIRHQHVQQALHAGASGPAEGLLAGGCANDDRAVAADGGGAAGIAAWEGKNTRPPRAPAAAHSEAVGRAW